MKKDVSAQNLLPFVELEGTLRRLQYGTLSLHFQVHRGKIVGVQGNQFQQIRFKEKENSAAIAVILAEVKDAYRKKKSGNLTFTVKFSEGDIKVLYVQKNYKKIYT